MSALMIGVLSVLMSAPPAAAGDEAAVVAQVTAFARAGDVRDVPALEGLLHPDFRVAFTMAGKPGLTLMSREAYIGAAKAGKIGGDARALKVERTRVRGDLAVVEGTLTGAKARFEATWTLARTLDGWRLLQDAVVFSPGG